MADYQLELRQVVDYPRCRIYREFIQTLIADRSIRTGGCSGLFYYVVLCSYANFRTSYRRIDGISYTVYPGEWICSITDITEWFRVRFHYQAFAILKSLQDRQLITFTRLGRGHIVKFSITDWRRNNIPLAPRSLKVTAVSARKRSLRWSIKGGFVQEMETVTLRERSPLFRFLSLNGEKRSATLKSCQI